MSLGYVRAHIDRDATTEGGPIRFVAATEGVQADGIDLRMAGALLDRYRANPVFLYGHRYFSRDDLPIGRGADVAVDGRALKIGVTFDQSDEFARRVEQKYRDGYMNAVSVGFDVHKWENGKGNYWTGGVAEQWELLELSAVPVPMDAAAVVESGRAALVRLLGGDAAARDAVTAAIRAELGELGFDAEALDRLRALLAGGRGAIAAHTTPKADMETAWDAGAQVKAADGAAALRRMHAWVDAGGDAEAKTSYKLPHHTASGEVVWRGVAAAMSRLMQGGTNIPDGDRRGVYDHLARHYKQFDKEAPEFRSAPSVPSDAARDLLAALDI